MIKTVVTPENSSVLTAVPNEYIGKKIEILMYAAEELVESQPIKNTMSQYKGILTSVEAQQLQQYVKQSREEWNTNI